MSEPKKILLRVPPKLGEAIQKAAEGERRSVNSEIIIAIENHLHTVRRKRERSPLS